MYICVCGGEMLETGEEEYPEFWEGSVLNVGCEMLIRCEDCGSVRWVECNDQVMED